MPVRLFRIFALTILLAFLALLASISARPVRWPAMHATSIGPPVVSAAPVAVYGGPSADAVRAAEYRTVAGAVLADNTRRWYEWASKLPPPQPAPPVERHPRRPVVIVAAAEQSPAPEPEAEPELVVAPDSIEQDILDVFGDAGPRAVRVATCESGLNPSAVNRNNRHVRGIFQIHDSWADEWADVMGVSYESSWMNAGMNIRFAKWLYDRSGWGPWACKG